MRDSKLNFSRRTLVMGGVVGVASLGVLAPGAKSRSKSGLKQPTIRIDANIATLVNVFTVEPDNQQALVDTLKEGTEEIFSKAHGFISSSVLKGKDGRRVVNYSQWMSTDDITAFRKDPKFGPYVQRLKALSSVDTMESDVVYTNHA